MPAQNKILKYQLEDRVLALSVERKSHDDIAKILTEEMEGKDSISQNTVSRFLKKVREERKEAAGAILVDYLNESLPTDLKLIDEVLKFHTVIFRGKLAGSIEGGEEVRADTLQDRRLAARDIHEILKTKLRFVGIDAGEGDGDGAAPVDLNKYRKKPVQEEQEANG